MSPPRKRRVALEARRRVPCAETYHITWTCYGQWLHGDARGYVDDRHRTPGEPYAYGHPDYYNTDFNRMKEEPCWLGDEQRLRAEAAIEEACSFRGWNLMAVNVQPDHVHVAVEARETDGVRARQVLKDRSTRALKAAYPPCQAKAASAGNVLCSHPVEWLLSLPTASATATSVRSPRRA